MKQLFFSTSSGVRLLLGLVFLGAALTSSWPLFSAKIPSGHDTYEYIPRLVEFHENIKHGIFLPRWAANLGNGHGEPFFIFNPPMIYYLGEIFLLGGSSVVNALNSASFLIVLLSGFFLFLLAREFWGPSGGIFGAVAYIYAPYFHVVLYVRQALADFSAFMFLPLTIYAFYKSEQRRGFVILASLALAGLLLSSNPIALVFFPVILLYLGLRLISFRNIPGFKRQSLALLLGLMISAYFWLPALLEKKFVKLDRLYEGYLNYQNHFVYLNQLWSSFWGYGISLPGSGDGMSFQIGWLHLALLPLAVMIAYRDRPRSWTTLDTKQPERFFHLTFFLGILLGSIFFSTYLSQWLWHLLPLLQIIEFPWRILTITAFTSSFLAGAVFICLPPGRSRLLLLATLLPLILLFYQAHARPRESHRVDENSFSPRNIAQHHLAATTRLEYEPVFVKELRAYTPDFEVLDGLIRPMRVIRHVDSLALDIQALQPSRLRVNIHYFPGWRLTIQGQEQPIDFSNRYGLMEFGVATGYQRILLRLQPSLVRAVSLGISRLGLLLLLGTTLWYLPLPRCPWFRFFHWRHRSKSSG
jgi:hypothetical protein